MGERQPRPGEMTKVGAGKPRGGGKGRGERSSQCSEWKEFVGISGDWKVRLSKDN